MVWLTVLKALLALLPAIVGLVREGRIRTGGQLEVVAALRSKFDARIDAAGAARDREHDERVPDPYDRAHRD